MIRYEDLVEHANNLDTPEADHYFTRLLEVCGIEKPDDWKERVRIGADRKQSGTARENLSWNNEYFQFPDELPETQKQILEYNAPGLRKLLGYE